MKKCFLCQKNEDIFLKRYKYWTILIHNNQSYLGRCIIKLNRHLIDLLDITDKERNELFKITKNLRNVIRKLFKADLFNYASLGNGVNHLHIHFIPRYKKNVRFANFVFKDKRWGKNYSPTPDYKISEKIFSSVKDAIRSKL